MDRNYVGFKKVTINAPTWIPGQMPTLGCESADWDGQCTHLATDAFLEFEDRVSLFLFLLFLLLPTGTRLAS